MIESILLGKIYSNDASGMFRASPNARDVNKLAGEKFTSFYVKKISSGKDPVAMLSRLLIVKLDQYFKDCTNQLTISDISRIAKFRMTGQHERVQSFILQQMKFKNEKSRVGFERLMTLFANLVDAVNV